jgi:hypothetical protein
VSRDHLPDSKLLTRYDGPFYLVLSENAASEKMASCNQKNMDKADAMLMKMPDGELWDAVRRGRVLPRPGAVSQLCGRCCPMR